MEYQKSSFKIVNSNIVNSNIIKSNIVTSSNTPQYFTGEMNLPINLQKNKRNFSQYSFQDTSNVIFNQSLLTGSTNKQLTQSKINKKKFYENLNKGKKIVKSIVVETLIGDKLCRINSPTVYIENPYPGEYGSLTSKYCKRLTDPVVMVTNEEINNVECVSIDFMNYISDALIRNNKRAQDIYGNLVESLNNNDYYGLIGLLSLNMTDYITNIYKYFNKRKQETNKTSDNIKLTIINSCKIYIFPKKNMFLRNILQTVVNNLKNSLGNCLRIINVFSEYDDITGSKYAKIIDPDTGRRLKNILHFSNDMILKPDDWKRRTIEYYYVPNKNLMKVIHDRKGNAFLDNGKKYVYKFNPPKFIASSFRITIPFRYFFEKNPLTIEILSVELIYNRLITEGNKKRISGTRRSVHTKTSGETKSYDREVPYLKI